MTVAVGLNPYGLTYHLGLQGMGTPRANPVGKGLEGFIAIAKELNAEVLEIFNPWLTELSDRQLKDLRKRLSDLGMTPVISAGIHGMGPIKDAFRTARLLDAEVIRLGLTPVLEGSRTAWGDKWFELLKEVHDRLSQFTPVARDEGRMLAIENHQDFQSSELVDYCKSFTQAVFITLDTGNTFPVGEAPMDFVARVAPYVRHVHLKDYRVQFTDEGYRLVRCAIGDGAVPIKAMLEEIGKHHPHINAVLEPGALEARHVRLFNPDWWRQYRQTDAKSFAAALAAARVNRLGDDEDFRTPWERQADGEIEDYELSMIRRSAANMRALGIMK